MQPIVSSSSRGTKRVFETVEPTRLNLLLSKIAPEKKLPSETDKIYFLSDFMSNVDALLKLASKQDRFEKFLDFFDFINISKRQAPSGIRAEVWLKNVVKGEEFYLFATICEDKYHSTSIASNGAVSGPFLYISVHEWIDDGLGGGLTDEIWHARYCPEDFSGEWMWVRNSPHFSGSKAKELAFCVSRAFFDRAQLWDTAHVKESGEDILLSLWLSISRSTFETFYSKQGFFPATCINLKGTDTDTVFTQSQSCYFWAIQTIRETTLEKITSILTMGKDQQVFGSLVTKYKMASSDPFYGLCQKVNSAFGKEGQRFCLNLVEGEVPVSRSQQAKLFDLARKVVISSKFLVASFNNEASPASKVDLKARALTYVKSVSRVPKEPSDFVQQIIAEEQILGAVGGGIALLPTRV
jgi:hypothetical protein